MGFVLSKFRKSKPSVKDTLDKIEQDLRKLSRFQYDTELQQKRIIGRLVIGGIFFYLIFLVLVYFFGPRDLSWKQTLAWIVPFVVFPILLITIKRVLGWYFNRKIIKNKEKYESLKKEKQRLLDDVMETETFKVAKEILEKYAPSHLLPKYLADQQKAIPASLTPLPRNAPGLRRRINAPINSTPYGVPGGFTPRAIRPYGQPGSGPGQFLRQPTNNFMRPAIMPGPSTPSNPSPSLGMPMLRGPPPPRFMLPPPPTHPDYRTRKTGWLDKLVDYVVGDGPANRYALVCRYCATHNGLATPEDFPYIGYRCVYCRQFNPPRQQRPSAQTLPRNTVLIEEMDSTMKSELSITDGKEAENVETKEDGNENQSGDDSTQRNEETDHRDSNEPVIELAASSVEDLTGSLENLQGEAMQEDSASLDFVDDDGDSLEDNNTLNTDPQQENDGELPVVSSGQLSETSSADKESQD